MSGPYALDELEEDERRDAETAAEDWLAELVVLSFRENRRGGDPIAHTSDGRAVFPDKFQGGDEILPGEHWICNVSQKGESTFFAAPVARLDERFLTGLSEEERRRMARVVAEEYPETLGDEMGEARREKPNDPHTDGYDEQEDLRARLSELSEQYDEAVARLVEAESLVRALEQQVDETGGARETETAAPDGGGLLHAREMRLSVRREGTDVLFCEGFSEGSYHGHVSPNRRTLFFKAYGRGPLQCRDHRVQVPGLDMIIEDHVEELEARFDPRHGGYFVEIPRS